MRYLLDTDSVSYALRGHGDVADRIKTRRPSETCMSAITLAELRFGADRKGSRKLHGLIDVLAAAIEVAPFDESAAAEFAGSEASWQREGRRSESSAIFSSLLTRWHSGASRLSQIGKYAPFLEGAWTLIGELAVRTSK